MFKSYLGDFIFIVFVVAMSQVVMNYAFEENPLSIVELFSLKKIISIVIGSIVGVVVMRLVRKSSLVKKINENDN